MRDPRPAADRGKRRSEPITESILRQRDAEVATHTRAPAAQKHRGVVVLGMGRSGTSSVARMFHRSGYFVGSQTDLLEGDEANPTGYFENWRMFRANEQVLAQLDGTWFDAPDDREQISLDVAQTRVLAETLDHLLETAGNSPLVVKDPRIGILMHIWWPLLAGVLHPVLVVRHPLEIALSLQRRDGTAIPVALAMWELHLTRLLGRLDGERVTVVRYRRVLEAPDLAARLVGEASEGLHPELRHAVRPAEAGSALDAGLRRNRADGTSRAGWLNAAQQRLWQLLDSLEPGTVLMRTPTWAGQGSETARAMARYEKSRQRAFLQLGARLEQAAQDLAERERLLAEQERALVERERQVAAASMRRAELESELRALREPGAASEERARVAQHWLAEIQSSRSWRATEPLRILKRGLSRLVR